MRVKDPQYFGGGLPSTWPLHTAQMRPDLVYQSKLSRRSRALRGSTLDLPAPVTNPPAPDAQGTPAPRTRRDVLRALVAGTGTVAAGAIPVPLPVTLTNPPNPNKPQPNFGVGCPQSTFSVDLVAGRSLEVSPSNKARRYLLVQNKSGAAVQYATNRPANARDADIAVGGNYEPNVPPTDSINLFSAAGGTVVVIEG